IYGGAFMINIDPRMQIPAPQKYTGSCSALSPVNYDDPNLSQCKDSRYFATCCTTGTYQDGYNHWGYLDHDGSSYCQQKNQSICAQNVKNQELANLQKTELQCFSAVDYLLSTGVQSSSGARYGVP